MRRRRVVYAYYGEQYCFIVFYNIISFLLCLNKKYSLRDNASSLLLMLTPRIDDEKKKRKRNVT